MTVGTGAGGGGGGGGGATVESLPHPNAAPARIAAATHERRVKGDLSKNWTESDCPAGKVLRSHRVAPLDGIPHAAAVMIGPASTNFFRTTSIRRFSPS